MIDENKLIDRFKQLKGTDSFANMFITDVIKEIQKQPKIDAWILCSEGLPNEREEVQVTYLGLFDNLPHCNGFAYSENGNWYWSDDDDEVKVKIIAWRLLEPYKE